MTGADLENFDLPANHLADQCTDAYFAYGDGEGDGNGNGTGYGVGYGFCDGSGYGVGDGYATDGDGHTGCDSGDGYSD